MIDLFSIKHLSNVFTFFNLKNNNLTHVISQHLVFFYSTSIRYLRFTCFYSFFFFFFELLAKVTVFKKKLLTNIHVAVKPLKGIARTVLSVSLLTIYKAWASSIVHEDS
jgi:hypothetical protein